MKYGAFYRCDNGSPPGLKMGSSLKSRMSRRLNGFKARIWQRDEYFMASDRVIKTRRVKVPLCAYLNN